MRLGKSTKSNDSPEELLNNAYKCKNHELIELLREIDALIRLEGNKTTLLRAKSVITTKLILLKEK